MIARWSGGVPGRAAPALVSVVVALLVFSSSPAGAEQIDPVVPIDPVPVEPGITIPPVPVPVTIPPVVDDLLDDVGAVIDDTVAELVEPAEQDLTTPTDVPAGHRERSSAPHGPAVPSPSLSEVPTSVDPARSLVGDVSEPVSSRVAPDQLEVSRVREAMSASTAVQAGATAFRLPLALVVVAALAHLGVVHRDRSLRVAEIDRRVQVFR